MSQPDAVSSAICCNVEFTSCVLVVHMDCTAMGWSLPTPTSPTISWRVFRRGANVGAGGAGMPSPIGEPEVIECLLLERSDRVDEVGGHGQCHVADHEGQDHVGGGHQLEIVHRRRGHQTTGASDHVADLFEEGHCDVTAVERQQGYQVDRTEHEVQLRQEEPEGKVKPTLEGV